MKHKILKKILGILNYKLIDKNYFKNHRIISNTAVLNDENLLNNLSNHKIKHIIQIGANDGVRFDNLNKFIKKNKINSILVEPIKKNFNELKKNYKNSKFVRLENVAISINNEINYLYKVEEKFLKYYDKHVPGITSFDKNHLLKHDVKEKHIIKEKVNSTSIKNLIKKYNLKKLDLLYIDTEGYDGKIVLDFLKIKSLNPIIIFEFIHVENMIFKKVINKLQSSKYKFFPINENLICLPKNKFFSI